MNIYKCRKSGCRMLIGGTHTMARLICVVTFSLASLMMLRASVNRYDYFHHVKTFGSEISDICRDNSSGTVWLATSRGLVRFGNAPFSQSEAITPERLSTPLRTVEIIPGHKLLIRTKGMSYKIYDPSTQSVVVDNLFNLFQEWGVSCNDPHSSEISVHGDEFWIRCGNKIFTHSLMMEGKSTLKAETDSEILCLLPHDSVFYALTSRKLLVYDIKTSSLRQSIDWPFKADTRNLKMARDGNGDIWVCNQNLYRCDMRLAKCLEVASEVSATDMAVSAIGNVYVATNTCGILEYDTASKTSRNITSDSYLPHSLTGNRLKSIFIDNESNLWVTYSKQGMSISNPLFSYNSVHHITSLLQKNIKDDIVSVMYDHDGNLWLGTDGNGLFTDKDSFSENRLPDWLTREKGADNPVTAAYMDSAGNIWCGIYHKGLLRHSSGKWTLLLPGSSPYDIVEDIAGNIYVATLGSGAFSLSPDNGYEPEPLSLDGRKYISQLDCNRRRTLFILFPSGLGIFDTVTGKMDFLTGNRKGTQKFRSGDLQTILTDSRGLVWLYGTDGYLDILDLKKDSIMQIATPGGVRINSMAEDDNRNIWMASDHGIVNIAVAYDSNLDKYNFQTFLYRHRLNEDESRHFNFHSAIKGDDGRIVFGSTDGFIYVNPAFYSTPATNADNHAAIVAMKVNNCIITPGTRYNGRVILHKELAQTDQLILKANENNLAFLLHPQDFATPFQTDYYYQLEGLSDSLLPIDNNTIVFTNLPVGSYTLHVSRRNPDGSFSSPISSLKLRVKAPWYATTWAIIIYALAAIGVTAAVIYYLSERRNQKLRLEQAEKEMERQYQINEMKLRFFTNISHDFRTPLTLIITPLEAYLNNKKNNPDVKFFTPIYRNAVRLLNLINQILDFRKLEVYGDELRLSNGDIVKFIKEICASFTMFAEDNDVQLLFSSEMPTFQMAFDRDKISKIMMNLLSNAFKHTPKGKIVKVSLTRVEDARIKIAVADSGPGVPDSEKTRIFGRFYQNKCDNSANMGSGVGLHIVKEYVALHEGTISVADNTPCGAVFTIILPVVQTGHPREEQPVPLPGPEAGDASGIKRQTAILLVEDNTEFLDFLQQSLSEDYRVLTATDGKEALKVLGDNEVDMVISDVMMDNMDGLDLCRHIKNNVNFSHIPVVLLTAKSMMEDEITGLNIGADDYITKPFNLSVLMARIRSILRARENYRRRFHEEADVKPSEITITSLDEKFLAKALEVVENNISSAEFSVEDLSEAMGMHRANLYRKLRSLTGKSPIEFIRLIRLRRACQYLRHSKMYVSEIAYAVGFNSPKLFARYFKEEYGLSPREFMQSQDAETEK